MNGSKRGDTSWAEREIEMRLDERIAWSSPVRHVDFTILPIDNLNCEGQLAEVGANGGSLAFQGNERQLA